MNFMKTRPEMTISRAANTADVGVETIRFYEREGLIERPPRPPGGGYRVYPSATVRRIRLLRKAQGLGFSLREAAALLDLGRHPDARAEAIREQALQKLADVNRRMRDLSAIQAALSELLDTCPQHGPAECCSIWQALTSLDEGHDRHGDTSMIRQTTLAVRGMHCDGCVQVIRHLLEREEGVRACSVSLEDGRARVAHDPDRVSAQRLAEVLTRAGYDTVTE